MQKPVKGNLLQRGHPLARGLVGCWLMNEGTGDKVADLSGNDNVGTLINMFSSDWVGAQDGFALDFDGTDDYVDCGASENLNFRAEAFSVVTSAQSNITSSANLRILTARDTVTAETPEYHGWKLFISAGDLTFHTSAGSGTDKSVASSGENFLDLMRHTFAGTRSTDGTLKCYADGRFLNVNTVSANDMDTALTPQAIAAKNVVGGWSRWSGLISFVFIYDREIAATEIQQLHADPYQIFNTGFNPAIFGGLAVAAGRLSRSHNLNGLGGLGQQTFNPME